MSQNHGIIMVQRIETFLFLSALLIYHCQYWSSLKQQFSHEKEIGIHHTDKKIEYFQAGVILQQGFITCL